MRVGCPVRSAARALVVCLAAAGCQSPPPPLVQTAQVPPPGPSPVGGVGYIILNAPISQSSSSLLIRGFDTLQAKGAHEIDLGINSAGGEVKAAQVITAEMDRLHAEDGIVFRTYDLHLVASAATLVFLDAQQRYAVPRSAFVFHAPFAVAAGAFSAEALRSEADRIDQAAQLFRQALLARTHLTRQQIDVYVTRTVLLSTDDAQRDGVIDAVTPAMAPKGTRVWVVKAKPRTPPAAQDTQAPGTGAAGATPS